MGPTARLAVASTVVAALDQVSKQLAHSDLLRADWVEPTTNPDLALGVAGGPSGAELVLGMLVLVMAGVLLGSRHARGRTGLVPAALVVGGSAGNLIDRATVGAVHDFIVGPAIVFNVADVALLAGVVWLALPVLLRRAPPGSGSPGTRKDGATPAMP